MSRAPIKAPGHREILKLAVPMVISNISIPLLGMVDTAVVGHLPEPHYLGAVAVGAMIFSFLFWGFGFLRMGTTGFVAQAHGSGSSERVQQRLAQAGFMALVLAALVLALQQPAKMLAFALVDASAPVEIEAMAYFSVRIWAAPATLMTYVLVGGFLGSQNAIAPLLIVLSTNLTNVALDLLFVVGFGWGVPGVALASVCGEYLGVVIGLVLAFRYRLISRAMMLDRDILRWADLSSMLSVNSDILIRTLCLVFAFAFFVRQGAHQGEVILAANAVLINFQNFMAYGLDGFAHAAEALVGRAFGARSRSALRAAVRLTGQWSLGVALVFCLLFWVSGPLIINMLTDLEAVRQSAYRFLPWLIVSPMLSVWSFWLDGVFIGATRAREMRNAMIFSLLVCYLPIWWLTRHWANHGLWLALMVFLSARGISMAFLYRLNPALSGSAESR